MLLLLIVAAYLSIYLQNRLPAEVPESAAANEFSSARALQKLRLISAHPHPIGSQEHAVVRDHIYRELSSLGLTPETQKTVAVNTRWGSPFPTANVQNGFGPPQRYEQQPRGFTRRSLRLSGE